MKTDLEIQADVEAELEWDPTVENSHVKVRVKDGIVVLTGKVPVYSQKHTAGEVAKRVHGVCAVANDVHVKRSEHHHRDDPLIAAAVLHALEWDAHVPHENVKLVVEDGWVKMEGVVQRHDQKEAISRAVRHLHGISGLNNLICVRPSAQTDELKASVEAALERSATLNIMTISVDIN